MRNLVGDEFEWDVCLVLARARIPSLRLDGNGHLGWTSWLPGKRRGPTTPTIWCCDQAAQRLMRRGSMTGISREAVFSKLNPLAYRALESAYQFARTGATPTSNCTTG